MAIKKVITPKHDDKYYVEGLGWPSLLMALCEASKLQVTGRPRSISIYHRGKIVRMKRC